MLSELIQFAKELPHVLFLDRVCRTFGVQEGESNLLAGILPGPSAEDFVDRLNGVSPAEIQQRQLLEAKRRELAQLEEALRLKEREHELFERKCRLEARLRQR